MLTYANGLHMNLESFGKSVNGIMQHLSVSVIFLAVRLISCPEYNCLIIIDIVLQSVSGQAVDDKDAVSLTHLDKMYGLPSGSLSPKTNMTPTIPIFFIRGCDRGPKYMLGLASDLQSRIAACLTIIKQCQREIFSVKWAKGFNGVGVRFGDKRFNSLPTYKT